MERMNEIMEKHIVMTERDEAVQDFITKFHAVKTTQIAAECFEGNDYVCRRRMKILTDFRKVKRCRDNVIQEYVFYSHKLTQKFTHYMKIADFYLELKSQPGEIVEFEVEKKIANVIPDAVVLFRRFVGDSRYMIPMFVEVHRCQNPFDQEKYERLYESGAWRELGYKTFPRIVIATNKHITIQPSKLNFIVHDEKTGDFHQILKIT